jgi:hypothetical protein
LSAGVIAIALLAAACGDDSDDASTDTTQAANEAVVPGELAGAQTLEITGEDYRYVDAPTSVEAGLINLEFTNNGTVDHEVAFASIGDNDVATFITDFLPVVEGEGGGPFPDYLDTVVAPGEIGPGKSFKASFVLPEGKYAMFCVLDGQAAPEGSTTTLDETGEGPTGEPHIKLGMAQAFEVTAGDDAAELPDTDSSITAKDYSFDVNVKAGDVPTKFVNEGPDQVHHAVFFPFVEGTSEADAATALDAFLSGDGPPPEALDLANADGNSDSGVFSSGFGELFTTHFESGRTYAAACFLSDRAGGPPHAIAHQMTKIFTVE